LSAPSMLDDHKNNHFFRTEEDRNLSHPKAQNSANQKQKLSNVPLQTREHAWAGISGMPWFTPGLKGHLVPRR
jgi:hypothetical protein